jgi:FMN phosphatase YigB (HAD superfamily)
MRRVDWNRFHNVVFDVDGTLYDQRRLRVRMIAALAVYCLADPRRMLEVRTLHVFRRERERLAKEEASRIQRLQYERPAQVLGIPPSEVEAVVESWIQQRPLRYLLECRLAGVEQLFARLRRSGRSIAVLSDYPAGDKLAALALDADVLVSAVDPEVDRLKPHPAGLKRVLERLGATVHDCLLIGDRDDRDGEVARRVGMRYLLRSSRANAEPSRFTSYSEILPAKGE